MKNIKHSRRDFHSVAWVMPQGSDLGIPWGVEWSKKIFFQQFNQIWCSNLHQWHMQWHNFFLSPPPWTLGRGQKVKYHKNLNHKVNFKDFLNQTLCVFSQLKDIKHIRRDFHLVPWVMPKGWDLGVPLGGLILHTPGPEIRQHVAYIYIDTPCAYPPSYPSIRYA